MLPVCQTSQMNQATANNQQSIVKHPFQERQEKNHQISQS